MSENYSLMWAALQDNILSTDDGMYRLTDKQRKLVNLLLGKELRDKENRRDVLDILFNPVCQKVTSIWLVSSNNITLTMARLLLDLILEVPCSDETVKFHPISGQGRGLIHFMENIVMDRNKLKGQLYSDRIELTTGGAYPVCAYCGFPIKDRSAAMHEAIITRGDVQKWDPDLITLINVPQNCVLVHQEKCHVEAQTKLGQRIVLLHLLKYNSAEEIALWINTLPFRSSLYIEALNKLKEVSNV